MTNHIEELMKVAGIKVKTESYCKWECEKPALETSPICYDADCLFRKIRTFYPAFTPAKQLELIKLIGIGNGINWSFTLSKYHLFKKWTFTATINTGVTEIEHTNFDQGLAELVLVLINENKLDKSEVRRILGDD